MNKLFILAVIGFLTFECSAQEKKLLAYWSFDEGKGDVCADTSGNKHTGKIRNTELVTWVDGRIGKALHFAGNRRKNNKSVVTVKRLKADLSKGFSVEAWIKMDKDFNWKKGVAMLVSNAGGTYGRGIHFYYCWRYFMIQSAEGSKEKSWKAVGAVPDLREKWVHVAATYDGNIYKIYVNGELKGSSKKDSKMVNANSTLSIGAAYAGAANGFLGIIDEVKIYNYALTPLEIVESAKSDD
jgi:Concanavalin A-like lectin/glucanases superfamily